MSNTEQKPTPKLNDVVWVQPQAGKHMVDESGKPYAAAPQRVTVTRYVLRALQFGDVQAVPEPALEKAPASAPAAVDGETNKAGTDKPKEKSATKAADKAV